MWWASGTPVGSRARPRVAGGVRVTRRGQVLLYTPVRTRCRSWVWTGWRRGARSASGTCPMGVEQASSRFCPPRKPGLANFSTCGPRQTSRGGSVIEYRPGLATGWEGPSVPDPQVVPGVPPFLREEALAHGSDMSLITPFVGSDLPRRSLSPPCAPDMGGSPNGRTPGSLRP